MQSLEELKKRVKAALYISGDEIQDTRWNKGEDSDVPHYPELAATAICLLLMEDDTKHVGHFTQDFAPEYGAIINNGQGRELAFNNALGNAYDYYEAMTSYPDTVTEPLDFNPSGQELHEYGGDMAADTEPND